jgi:hypothetical protein
MNEQDWLACSNVPEMLRYLGASARASPRKLRLFACAACRRIWKCMRDERSHKAIEVSELFADGLASEADLQAAAREADVVATLAERTQRPGWNAARTAAAVAAGAQHAANRAAESAAYDADLLRDVFGNPFRISILSVACLDWNDRTIPRLAQAAYDQRILPAGTLEPARLAILTDALEEAGCTDADLLAHLRGPGPHVRGCWAVDLLLQKV